MIYITGDTHGDIKRFSEHNIKKLKNDDVLIICGDFGFIWDGSLEEKKILNKLGQKKYKILFIDGKHENFDLLENYPIEEMYGAPMHHIAGNLYHMLRGEVYNIEGKKIFCFGGGESPDKEYRTINKTWWEKELPTIEEMRKGVAKLNNFDKTVDYIITHEPPLHIKKLIYKNIDSINVLESFFDEVSKRIKFDKWFFGCIHMDRKISPKHYVVFNDLIVANDNYKKEGTL